jgi:Heavy metal associated domain 2
MELEGLKVVHALPGRVRLKAAKVKGNPALARRAEKKLAQVPGIKQVEARASTGSLLIHYDLEDLFSEASLEALSATLGELFPEIEVGALMAGLLSLTENPAVGGAGSAMAEGITGSLSALNTGVSKITGGLDLKVLVPLGLIFWGLRGILAAEKISPPSWSNLLWFGFASFIMLNRGLVEGSSGTGPERKA